MKIRQHFFVCTNTRPPFAGASCGVESNQILFKLREEVEKRNLTEEIKVTGCDCLGPCDDGPMMVVYPEGCWYKKVKLGDITEIVETHMVQGKVVKNLIYNWQ